MYYLVSLNGRWYDSAYIEQPDWIESDYYFLFLF